MRTGRDLSAREGELELVLGAPAAGGGFVAHDSSGRVVFVRHGMEGEHVLARLTEEHATWARADAVEVLEPSADRVAPRCPYAGPGGCGGCDYQHLNLAAQRRVKTALLAAQLRELAGDVTVEPASLDGDGLGTRTRVRFVVGPDGRLAMRRHRSHELVSVQRCALGVDQVASPHVDSVALAAGSEVEAVALPGATAPTIAVTAPGRARRGATRVLSGTGFAAHQSTRVGELDFTVSAGVFWQVHARAAALLTDAVLEGLGLAEGDAVCDLYCGAGLFTKAVAHAVGPKGSVVGVDSSRRAIEDARASLRAMPWATVHAGRVDARTAQKAARGCTHAVMDPPRAGTDAGALRAIGASSVTTLVSVSCDPATFARDLRRLAADGWRIEQVRAFDLFEMTEHLECVAVLRR